MAMPWWAAACAVQSAEQGLSDEEAKLTLPEWGLSEKLAFVRSERVKKMTSFLANSGCELDYGLAYGNLFYLPADDTGKRDVENLVREHGRVQLDPHSDLVITESTCDVSDRVQQQHVVIAELSSSGWFKDRVWQVHAISSSVDASSPETSYARVYKMNGFEIEEVESIVDIEEMTASIVMQEENVECTATKRFADCVELNKATLEEEEERVAGYHQDWRYWLLWSLVALAIALILIITGGWILATRGHCNKACICWIYLVLGRHGRIGDHKFRFLFHP